MRAFIIFMTVFALACGTTVRDHHLDEVTSAEPSPEVRARLSFASGRQLLLGEGTSQDISRALERFVAACELGNIAGCRVVADIGDVTPSTASLNAYLLALSKLWSACLRHDERSCQRFHHLSPAVISAVTRDRGLAACAAGHGEACHIAAPEAKRDPRENHRLNELACIRGSVEGCQVAFGEQFQKPLVDAYERAAERSCRAGVATDCLRTRSPDRFNTISRDQCLALDILACRAAALYSGDPATFAAARSMLCRISERECPAYPFGAHFLEDVPFLYSLACHAPSDRRLARRSSTSRARACVECVKSSDSSEKLRREYGDDCRRHVCDEDLSTLSPEDDALVKQWCWPALR